MNVFGFHVAFFPYSQSDDQQEAIRLLNAEFSSNYPDSKFGEGINKMTSPQKRVKTLNSYFETS